MKRISSLFLALALCLSLALPASAAESEGFSDVRNHYAKAAVETWSGYGVLKGYPDGSFKPNEPVTRAELAVVLDRVMGYRSAAENTFSDVPERAWYAQSILHLVEEGIFQGRKAGQMMPKSAVTRQEAFAALARAMDVEESGEAPGFADDGAVASWAKGCLAAMKAAGYIKGDKNGAIRPDDPITRAELVTILDRMIPGFVNEDGTYSQDCEGNLVINAQDVRLEDMTVEGDLIVADGVGEGDVYIERVTVKGDIILRGCGENSFHILPGCDVKNIIVTKTTGGIIRLVNESGKTIPMIFVNDGKAGVTLDGDALGEVVVACDAPVTIAAKSVKTLSVTGGAKLTVNKDATVSSLELAETAKTAQVTVEGKVSKLTNDAGVKVDKQNGGSVGGSSGSGGSSSGGSSSGGSSSGGSGGSTTTPKTVSEVTLQLLAPAFGKIPDTADALGVGYSAKTEWFNADGSAPSYRWKAPGSTEEDTFTADQAYRAVVTLSPVSGYTFGSALKVNVTDGNGNDFTPIKSEKSGNNWVVTLEYEKTEHVDAVENVRLTGPDFVYANKAGEKEIILSLSYSDNSLIDPATYVYKWYKCSDYSGSDKTLIAGVNTRDYTVPVADIQAGADLYYLVEIIAGGETYSSSTKRVEIRNYTPIREEDIPQPVLAAEVEFAPISQEDAQAGFPMSITTSNLINHPDVEYNVVAVASGPNNEYVVTGYGDTNEYGERPVGNSFNMISPEGTAEVSFYSDTRAFKYCLDNIYVPNNEAAEYHFVIDTVTMSVTPSYIGTDGTKKLLTDKKVEKTYKLGGNAIHYHLIGMEANVTGEAAEYRPSPDSKLIVDQSAATATFVKPDGSDGFSERCNTAEISWPYGSYTGLSGMSAFKNENNPELVFEVNREWIAEFQESTQDTKRLTTALMIYVPGKTNHHLYVYRIEVPAENVVFAGGNS